MSAQHTFHCDFCGTVEAGWSAAPPHGWASLAVTYGAAKPLVGTLHACPKCQHASQAKSLWAQVDRVMALEAGVPSAMPVPVVVLDADEADSRSPGPGLF